MDIRRSPRLSCMVALVVAGLTACALSAGDVPPTTALLSELPVPSPLPRASPSLSADDNSIEPQRTATAGRVAVEPTVLASRPPDDASGWTTFTTDDGLPHNEVWSIAPATDGGLWFATSDGLARFDGDSWQAFHIEDDNGVGAYVRSVSVAGDGTVWAGTFVGGVSWSRGGAWTACRTPIDRIDGPIANDVQVVHASTEGVLWVGTRAGLSRFDGQAWSHVTPEDGLSGFDVLAIAEGANGVLWVGTRGDFINPAAGGLSRYDGEAWESFTEADGLAEDYVQSVAVGPDGSVWVGTQSRGVARFDGRIWETYTTPDGLPSDDVTAVVVADDGIVWVGTRGAGAARFDGGTWETFNESDGLASNDVRAIVLLPNGVVWFATADGASRYVPVE